MIFQIFGEACPATLSVWKDVCPYAAYNTRARASLDLGARHAGPAD